MINKFWHKICVTGSILLNVFTSIFSALLVNYGINFLRHSNNMDEYELFSNIMVIISSIMIICNIIGLNIILLKSERLLEKIKDTSDIVPEEWLFTHSYSNKVKDRAIALFICLLTLLLVVVLVPFTFYLCNF